MSSVAVLPSRVDSIESVTRLEQQRSKHIYDQIIQVASADASLTSMQKEALMRAVKAKVNEMLLNRDFFQGIPCKIAIGGNHFNITPPPHLGKDIGRAALLGVAGTGGAAFAAACPAAASATVAIAVSHRVIKSQIQKGRNPLGLNTMITKLSDKSPAIGNCSKALYGKES